MPKKSDAAVETYSSFHVRLDDHTADEIRVVFEDSKQTAVWIPREDLKGVPDTWNPEERYKIKVSDWFLHDNEITLEED